MLHKCVTVNDVESSPKRPVWTISTVDRISCEDSAGFGTPHVTDVYAEFDISYHVVGYTDGCTISSELETGTDQVTSTATTAITSNIESGDFDISQGGDGEFFAKIRRFIPDFVSQTGNTQITLQLRNYSNNSQASSALGPFTISSSTTKVDTRARARAVSLKIANTAASQNWKLGGFRLDIQPDGRR